MNMKGQGKKKVWFFFWEQEKGMIEILDNCYLLQFLDPLPLLITPSA
jgi:hypothetical protein